MCNVMRVFLFIFMVVAVVFPAQVWGETDALYEASVNGNVEMVSKVLAAKPQMINALNADGQTALQLAVWKNKKDVVMLLLQKGADVNLQDKQAKRSALHFVGMGGDLEIAKMLIKAGADVNSREIDGETPLYYAAYGGFIDIVKLLIEHGAIVKGERTKIFTSPLGYAVNRNHLDVVRLLVENGADVLEKRDNGFNLLHAAGWNGSKELVEYLIEAGIPVDSKTDFGRTPLHNAAGEGNDPVVMVLVQKGADINSIGEEGVSPLSMAVRHGNTKSVAILLKAGAATDYKEKKSGRNLLHTAAILGYGKITALLLEKGADFNATDVAGKTPVQYAAQYGNTIAAKLLVEKGAKTENVKKNFGPSPLLKKELKEGDALVWYLGHSGWGIKTSQHFLIFDYYKSKNRPDEAYLANGTINLEELAGQKVMLFSSHSHGDHFMPEIMGWQKDFANLTYIMGFQPKDKGNYTYVAPRETQTIDGVEITAIKSNDSGAGFLVKVDGVTIFHPGDHANRKQDFSGPFKEEIDFLAAKSITPDLYFTPISGCGFGDLEAVKIGAYYTVKKLQPSIIFPMHGGAEQYNEFAQRAIEKGLKTPFYCAQNSGDHFFFRKGETKPEGVYTVSLAGGCSKKDQATCKKAASSCNNK